MSHADNEHQLKVNRDAYAAIQEEMEKEHMGRLLLMHDGEVVEIFDDGGEAYAIACERFGPWQFLH